MKNEKISYRDPEPALKKLLDSGKSQDKGLILKDRPSSPLRKGLIYLYCLTNPTGIGLPIQQDGLSYPNRKGPIHYKEGPNKISKLSRPAIEMKAGSRPLLHGMAGKEAEDLVGTSTSLSANGERSRTIDTSTSSFDKLRTSPKRSRGTLTINPQACRRIDNAHFLYYQGLYAVVSNVSTDEFSEENLKKNLADLEWVKTKAGIHEKIIETVMKNSCVIPFKFGTIFNTEENLKTMLKKHISKFKDTLKYLGGKEEWGVKIYCDLAKLEENLAQEDKELLSLNNEIDSASPGKAYILKKKKEDLVKRVVNKKLNEYSQYSFEKLNQRAIGSRINKLLPKEVTERKDDMILNSVFLIYKDKVSNFMDILNVLKELFENKGLFFDCTGPWPPYNFCEATTYGAKRPVKSQSDFRD